MSEDLKKLREVNLRLRNRLELVEDEYAYVCKCNLELKEDRRILSLLISELERRKP